MRERHNFTASPKDVLKDWRQQREPVKGIAAAYKVALGFGADADCNANAVVVASDRDNLVDCNARPVVLTHILSSWFEDAGHSSLDGFVCLNAVNGSPHFAACDLIPTTFDGASS